MLKQSVRFELLVAFHCMLALSGALETAIAQQSEAISREFTVFKGQLTVPIAFQDAIARELTVYNDLTNPIPIKDAVTREFSVANRFRCTGNMTDDGLVTAADIDAFVNTLISASQNPLLREAADINCDGEANGMDVSPFVACLLGGPCP